MRTHLDSFAKLGVIRLVGVTDSETLAFWRDKLPKRSRHLASFIAPTAGIPDVGLPFERTSPCAYEARSPETGIVYAARKSESGSAWIVEIVSTLDKPTERLPVAVVTARFPTRETAFRALASHDSRVNALRLGLGGAR